jgi:large-conductance mechanosensitive channel
MYLLLSIILCGILGVILLMMGPLVGGLIAFAVIAGCIFRGIYLLNDINNRLNTLVPKKDKVQEVYESYLKEKEKEKQTRLFSNRVHFFKKEMCSF